MTENNQHYRYCFYCNKWKTKQEINEVDLGGGNKTFNCSVCRKDLGDTIQIFYCDKHPEEVLKVWGVMEGINQEKIFSDKCSQVLIGKTAKIVLISGGVIALLIILIALIMKIKRKKKRIIGDDDVYEVDEEETDAE